MLSGEQKVVLKTLRAEIQHNLDTMNGILNKLANDFPKAYKHALTQKATRMLLCNERRNIRQLQTDGMLSDKDAERLYERVDERTEKLNSLSHTIPASFVRWLMFKKKRRKNLKQKYIEFPISTGRPMNSTLSGGLFVSQ